MDFARVLDKLAEFFEREDLPYALVGAFGLQAYGLSRATLDLDFVTDFRSQAKLLPFMESLGYETLHASSGYSNHVHPDPALGRVDFVYVRGETARLIFEGATTFLPAGDRSVPVPRPEHLAAMKIQAMKNDPQRTFQELADIGFLLRLPGIDEEEVRGYFEKQGLGHRYDELKKIL